MTEHEVDPVNHPLHYTKHPSGVECIEITEHMNFCLGNAVKYLWRAADKDDIIEDLEKAKWYINREIERLQAHEDPIEEPDFLPSLEKSMSGIPNPAPRHIPDRGIAHEGISKHGERTKG